jgi:hypothetical protein
MVAGFDLSALSETEKEQRFAAIEADSAEVFARFALDEGFGAPTVANIATAVAKLNRRASNRVTNILKKSYPR